MSDPKDKINGLVSQYDRQLREQFGDKPFEAGWCLLLGRYYGQSKTIYFSLNPGIPRSGGLVDPQSWGEWNVPFLNPPELKREYVYLQNCQRFFESDSELSRLIQDQITSAFLIPWRTRNMAELTKLNAITGGKVYEYGREIAKSIIADHKAEVIVAVGKAALALLNGMQVLERPIRKTAVLGPGGSYQWSRWEAAVDGRLITILQIPHFSRANSSGKMSGLAGWLREEFQKTSPILAIDEQFR